MAAQNKCDRTIDWLKVKRFGSLIKDSSQHVLNKSDYKLSDMESFALAHGFNFGIPNQNIKREYIFAEFELLYAQLSTHQAMSNEAVRRLGLGYRTSRMHTVESRMTSRIFTCNGVFSWQYKD